MFQRILGKAHTPVQTAAWLALIMIFLGQGAQKARSGSGKEETTLRRASLGVLQSPEQIPGDVPTAPQAAGDYDRAKKQLDPQAQAVLDKIAASVTLNPTTAAEARKAYFSLLQFAGRPEDIFKVEDRQIPGPAGRITIRVYTPGAANDLPVLVYFHGGGFTTGDLNTHDTLLRALANRAGSIIVSVAYRLAPEHQFPAAPEDCYAATKWVAQHAAEIGGNAKRLAVGGDGAGGNLAAVVALMARDRAGPALVHQVLIYPSTDATMSRRSWREVHGPVLTNEAMVSLLGNYLTATDDLEDPYISPLFAKSLKSLPPALVITAEQDPLRDEGEAYAKRLQEAGVQVKATRYPGMIHGFVLMAGAVDAAKTAIDEAASALRETFPGGPSSAASLTADLPEGPEVGGQDHVIALTLRAVSDANGHDAFSFNGQMAAPVIRVSPGDTLKMEYVNALPSTPREPCAISPCRNMTNLHFHGLGVSPKAPQDDVLDMMAMPGQTLNYLVEIPLEQPPGLYWYHTHPHGESHRQALDGMSGAIVVEGIDRYVPEVRNLRERVLVLRGRSIEHDPEAAALGRRVEIPMASCGRTIEEPGRIFTVNGVIRPEIAIAPGERQFWRIVNAAADSYADVQVDGERLEIVALDGMPLAYHNPRRRTRLVDHALVPPGGRIEAIVIGPPAGAHAVLRARCVDTGPEGDPNPEMVLADIVPGPRSLAWAHVLPTDKRPPVYKLVQVEDLEKTAPQFVVTFTEDRNGFYINGQKYAPDAGPMVRARVGSYQHWRIVNQTRELHPMHIHQVHFLAYAENGVPLANPEWLDTVNVPYGGSVDAIMDFTDPVIRGMSVFHCHLLNHEDKGMMAKILFK
jgi:suppressor of ftsI